jgi:hypothetical protein
MKVIPLCLLSENLQTEQEAIELANDSKYGLGAGIWTENLSRAHRVAEAIEAGLVWVNTHHRNDPSSPWYVNLLQCFSLFLRGFALVKKKVYKCMFYLGAG